MTNYVSMVSKRSFVFSSTRHPATPVTANEPVNILRDAIEHALAAGLTFADPTDEQVAFTKVTEVVPTSDERKAKIYAAFSKIRADNSPKDFTGSGTPSQKAVERVTGLSVDMVDVGRYYTEYLQDLEGQAANAEPPVEKERKKPAGK